MKLMYKDTWDLDSIYPGGTKSTALQARLEQLAIDIDTYGKDLSCWDVACESSLVETLAKLLDQDATIQKGLGQAATFVMMVQDAYMDDAHANVMNGKVMDLYATTTQLANQLMGKLVALPEETWNELLKEEPLQEIAFVLGEIRERGKRLLSEETEKWLARLHQDGLAGWSNVYDTVVSTMSIPFTDKEGKTVDLSVGQAMNRMYADPNPEIRKQLFTSWEKTWTKNGPIFADVLNHLAGYRLTLQEAHGRTDHLEEPMELGRMSRATLDAMWTAVGNNKQPFLDYLQKKAELLEVDALGWQDVDAPIALGDREPSVFTYEEACQFILEHFTSFGKELPAFAEYALENRWIEAEDRPNKRPGGYCASLPEWEESRIFMTFSGTPSDVSTLAHELGHAFHSHVMKEEAILNQDYAMNVAETASTFAETIMNEANVANAKTREEKIALLGNKLDEATAMLMNIHARFLFEDAFYTERAEGVVAESRLNELMIEAQKEAYGNSLATYHPHFWASKLHFFGDSMPFYNYPYTFGYLFSLGIYAAYQAEPEGFEAKYIALLRDTGKMNVEDLAEKHLNVDIRQPAFWEAGIQVMVKDVETFMSLVESR